MLYYFFLIFTLSFSPLITATDYDFFLGEIKDRAPRADAPAVTQPDATVGKNSCDLTQVLGLLAALKKRILILENITCDKFEQTWTILEEITDAMFTLTVDISIIFTVLDEIEVDIFDTQTILCNKFEQTWTILSCIQDIPVGSPITINTPGTYCLIRDIVGTISINASGVILNLNNHSISGGVNNIFVNGQTDIFIKNGVIANATNNGILFDGTTGAEVSEIDFVQNATGISILTSTCITIIDALFRSNSNAGIYGEASCDLHITDNKFLQNERGVVITNVTESLIDKNSELFLVFYKANILPFALRDFEGQVLSYSLVNIMVSSTMLVVVLRYIILWYWRDLFYNDFLHFH